MALISPPSAEPTKAPTRRVFIGDQADRSFWKDFRAQVPRLDIVIDDGGHMPEQQIVSLEELLPHLSPGGVYICEDIHGKFNEMAAYVAGLTRQMNAFGDSTFDKSNDDRRAAVPATPFSAATDSIHLYPFMAVIERRKQSLPAFVSQRHGSSWQPFIK